MLQMIFPRTAIYQNVIEKHQYKFSKVPFKNVIHQRLEGGWRIGQSEWHHKKLIMPMMSVKGSFRNVRRMDPYLMITRAQIQFRKIPCSMQLI